MDAHCTFTAVSGFGLRVIPRAPYRVVRGPGARELDVSFDGPDGTRFARLAADGAGGYSSRIGDNTPSLADVLDVEPGPVSSDWQLDVRPFRVAFPRDFVLHSVPAGSYSPFNLVGPRSSLIYVQSPARIPALTAMCAPDQEIADTGADWIEVAYEHEGRRWWQRHAVTGRLVFTAQAPHEARDDARKVLDAVVRSLVLA